MVVFLGEPPVRFLCCCCSFLIFILLLYLHLSMFFILLLFLLIAFDVIPHPSVDYRWSFYTPFYTFSPAHRRVIRDTFIFSAIPFLPRALQLWVGIFYPQALFTLRSFADILTCVYQGFPGGWQFILEVCRASYWSSKDRLGPSVCLIHSNPQTSYSEQFSFKMLLNFLIGYGEILIYLLLTRFELFSLVQSIRKDH